VRVPLAIWLGAAGVVLATAAVLRYAPFDSATWSRWDSILYEDIARDGYDLFRCPAGSELTGWCGDAGWFPAYSWLIGGLHLAGLPLRGTAVVVSWALAGATIVLLWATFLERRTGATAVAALVFAAFTPGVVYHYAVFPLSLLALSTIGCLWFLVRGRWLLAGAAGAVAVLSYPLGVVLFPVAAVWILLERRVPARERLRRVASSCGPMVGALLVFALDQRLETGRWNAYYLVQEKYGHEWQSPLAAWWHAITTVSGAGAAAIAVQTALVTVALGAVLVHAVARRRTLDRTDELLLLWAVGTWVVPLSQSVVALQRTQAALLPLAVLVARLPRRVLVPLAASAIPVAVLMEVAFLRGTVV
jgi:hypothetical protein